MKAIKILVAVTGLAVLMAVVLPANGNGYFEVEKDTGKFNAQDDSGTTGQWKFKDGLYRVYVTQAQYDMGFAAYTNAHPADYAAKIELAKDEEADIADFDPQVRALGLVYLDEINILRAEHGLPLRTKAQLSNAVKAKMAE